MLTAITKIARGRTMAALTLAARLALLASAASAAPELPALYGMAGIALPNGAIYAAQLALGPIDASGDAVALSSAAVVDDVHFLDGMSSGCGFSQLKHQRCALVRVVSRFMALLHRFQRTGEWFPLSTGCVARCRCR